MKISICTDIGAIRSDNEDTYYINGTFEETAQKRLAAQSVSHDSVNILGIFDGMGGEACGKLASKIAAENLRDYQGCFSCCNRSEWDGIIHKYVNTANDSIDSIISVTHRNMGTTMALLIAGGDAVRAYNMGDSRIYSYSSGLLKQLSRDHTVAAQLVEAGLISEDDARRHAKRNTLTKHLGLPKEQFDILPHKARMDAAVGDAFIICSDGLTDVCDDSAIEEVLRRRTGTGSGNIAETLVDIALAAGSRDNITVVYAQI